MEFSLRRVKALFKKEVKDFGKNINVSIMCIIPILLSIFYVKVSRADIINDPKIKVGLLLLCIGMNISFIAISVIAMMIAEEKEKNTLRTLMLSAVSPWEFFTGKALITFIVSEVINVAIFFILGCDSKYLVPFIIITTLVIISMIEIGAIVGILSPSQMATGVASMPVLGIFFVLPLMADKNSMLGKITKLLPNYHMNSILQKAFKGEGIFTGSFFGMAVIVGWIIICAIGFSLAYKKTGFDK